MRALRVSQVMLRGTTRVNFCPAFGAWTLTLTCPDGRRTAVGGGGGGLVGIGGEMGTAGPREEEEGVGDIVSGVGVVRVVVLVFARCVFQVS